MNKIELNKYVRYFTLSIAIFVTFITIAGFITYGTLSSRGTTAQGIVNDEGNVSFEYEDTTYDTRISANQDTTPKNGDEIQVLFDPENPVMAITTSLDVFRGTFITAGIWAVLFYFFFYVTKNSGEKKKTSQKGEVK